MRYLTSILINNYSTLYAFTLTLYKLNSNQIFVNTNNLIIGHTNIY